MQKTSLAIVLSLAAAAGAATLVLQNSDPESSESTATGVVNHFDENAATEKRILALEAAVSEERRARQLLEDELLFLFAEIEQLEADREDRRGADEEVREARGNVDSETVVRRQQFREERQTTGRRDAMVEAGMAPDRADYILRRESEMRFESMQAVYEARNSGEPLEFNRNFNADAMLREEIGDTEYEMYLEANNRSTSVGITSVMASSPGERAGLQAGDEIVGYDGERVFSTSELIQQTMAGGDGDVVVDVMRDGSAMQIVLPRGPIGVEIGRFRGR
jgi:C-terminal processing protease CtpA/Prc